MGRSCVKIREGSGFFAAEDYILTCRHVFKVKGKVVLDEEKPVTYLFENNEYMAEVKAIDEEHDLVLLHAVTAPADHSYKELDRVAKYKTPVIVKGFPNNEDILRPVPAKVGKENGNGKIALYEANGTSQGDSGGPVCPETEEDRVVGIFHFIMGRDKDGRQVEMSGMIPASVALELWGEFVEEAHYSVAPNENNPFVYNSLKTDFIDPYNNLEKLQSFINATDRVLWWPVVAEGGSGKSRLAHEVATSLSSEWRCYILPQRDLRSSTLDGKYFSAGRNVLFIADYANTDSGELGDWLNNAYRNPSDYPYKIRVLLLQRHGKGKDGSPSYVIETLLRANRNLREHRYTAEDLVLKKLGKKSLMDLMRSYAIKERGIDLDDQTCSELYDALENVDEDLTRPLFAMFITDAYLNGDPYNYWKPEAALAHFADRELGLLEAAIPKSAGMEMEKVAVKLWVLATICHGCSFTREHLPEATHKVGSTVSVKDLGNALEIAGYAKEVNGTWVMDPMEPDILGEFFVLKQFREYPNSIQRLLDEAYRISPENTEDFLTRMFADHPTDIGMITACRGETSSFVGCISRGLAMRKDKMLLHMMHESTLNLDKALGRLEVLYRQFPDNETVAIQYSKGLFEYFVYQEDSKNAEELLKRLEEVYKKLPQNEEGAVWYAGGLAYHLIYQKEPEKAEAALAKLEELYEQHPDNAVIAVQYARGLANHLIYQRDFWKAEEVLGQLKELSEQHLDNAEVTVQYAKGLTNHLIYQKDPEKAETLLRRLKELCGQHPTYERFAVQYAEGLSIYLGHLENPWKAEELLKRLEKLYRQRPDNAEILNLYEKGLFNYYVDQEDPEKAEKLLGQMKKLYKQYPDNAEVAVWYARGLLKYFDHQKDLEKKKHICWQLRTLHEQYPDNVEIADCYNRALRSL